jgi:hypothetical protein
MQNEWGQVKQSNSPKVELQRRENHRQKAVLLLKSAEENKEVNERRDS